MTTEIAEYSATEAALADYTSRFKGVIFEVDKPEGMIAARTGRRELREARVALEKTRKEIKEPALRRIQQIDSEAKRISTVISSLEDPIDEQIKAEDKRKDDERLAAAKAEQNRQDAIERERKQAEEMALAEQRAEIARQQEELRKAEVARVEADRQARLKIEAEERAHRLKIEAEERTARQAREEADRQSRLKRDAEESAQRALEEKARKVREAEEAVARALRQKEEDKLRAEREAIEAEKRKVADEQRRIQSGKDEAERVARLAEEQKQRAAREEAAHASFEASRKALDLKDGRKALIDWHERYGIVDEFRPIAALIAKFLTTKKTSKPAKAA